MVKPRWQLMAKHNDLKQCLNVMIKFNDLK